MKAFCGFSALATLVVLAMTMVRTGTAGAVVSNPAIVFVVSFLLVFLLVTIVSGVSWIADKIDKQNKEVNAKLDQALEEIRLVKQRMR